MTNGDTGLRAFRVGTIRAQLRVLRLWDDLEGMIEGPARLHRRFRLMQFDARLAETSGLYVHNLDEIRADAAGEIDTWLPRGRAQARLTANWRPEGTTENGQTSLSVEWFQQPAEDPFTRLAEIVAPLDWVSLAKFEPDEA
ncbi:hypothetical protein [Stackebrandtia soli]|uniref:hypothetical protein n=1 Tax=Stackebrandtia soli TaxID=1892856 RepID=UPI0039E75AA0